MNLTTRADAVAALRAHYMPELLKVEDFEAFESIVASNGKSLLAGMMAACLAGFDESLRGSMPRGWSAHHRARRKLATLVGPVEFERTVFVDEFGRCRALLDELLSIPPRSRSSPGAFLWLVGRAAEESYRKTAAAFLAETGCRVSHVAAMGCVRRAAELLRRREPPASGRISQPTLFLEVDGLWVHLQSPEHRDEALPRFLYEQARKAASFELKLAALYAGKKEVAPGRYERGGLRLTCADLPPQGFWDEVWAMLSAEYDPDDVGTLWVGADGGKWCGPGRIADPRRTGKASGRLFPQNLTRTSFRGACGIHPAFDMMLKSAQRERREAWGTWRRAIGSCSARGFPGGRKATWRSLSSSIWRCLAERTLHPRSSGRWRSA